MSLERNNDTMAALLADATAGPSGAPSLWQNALRADDARRAPRSGSLGAKRISTPVGVAVIVLLMVVIAGAMVPALGKARSSARSLSSYSEPDGGPYMDSRWLDRSSFATEYQKPMNGGAPTSAASMAETRHVIRKLTIDLTTSDVRSVFAKTGLVINEALGEYVETSSITGDGPTTSATITLRVAASRVSEVMNQLRSLGVVTAETVNGQDVTDAVFDLDARLRNEERIERELLELIDKRPDAPLKDLLEIRAQLAQVRGQIESLVGQKERIGRLVSLATVLVSIRTEQAVVETKAEGLGAYFIAGIERAWEGSLRNLADAAAFLVRTVVGGLVWWVILAIAVFAVWRMAKRVAARHAREPAPLA